MNGWQLDRVGHFLGLCCQWVGRWQHSYFLDLRLEMLQPWTHILQLLTDRCVTVRKRILLILIFLCTIYMIQRKRKMSNIPSSYLDELKNHSCLLLGGGGGVIQSFGCQKLDTTPFPRCSWIIYEPPNMILVKHWSPPITYREHDILKASLTPTSKV